MSYVKLRTYTHKNSYGLIHAQLHKCTAKDVDTHTGTSTHLHKHAGRSCLFLGGCHLSISPRHITHIHTNFAAKESECFLLLNAAPSEPPVNRPDYFIMNLNLSSRAVSSDRSLGLTNAPGYFWQHKNPQNMESFHISILSNNLSHY